MMLRCILLLVAFVTVDPAGAEPYDHGALLRTLGYSAGQAAACGLDTTDKAAAVVTGLAAAIGYTDEGARKLLEETAAGSRQRGCRTFIGDDLEFRARWARMKRRAEALAARSRRR